MSLLDEVDIRDPRYEKALRERISIGPRGRYVNYKDAMELTKAFQPADPTNPKKDFLRELRLAVIDELGLNAGAEERVKAYTAVGTPLDKLHGVDGFMTIKTEDGAEVAVTFDVTLRDKAYKKADLVIGEPPNPHEDEEGYLKLIEEYAAQIADKFKQKTGRFKKRPSRTFGPTHDTVQP